MIRIKEGFEASNCWFNEKIRQFGSILELECMLVHIMRVGLKGSNFQGWPISLPVSSIALDFALTNNLTSSRTLYYLTMNEPRRCP